jgi:hypothetical protein
MDETLETRRISASIFGNEKLAEIVLSSTRRTERSWRPTSPGAQGSVTASSVMF